MHVVLQPSPSVAHKLRVILPDKRAIDFGKKGEQLEKQWNKISIKKA